MLLLFYFFIGMFIPYHLYLESRSDELAVFGDDSVKSFAHIKADFNQFIDWFNPRGDGAGKDLANLATDLNVYANNDKLASSVHWTLNDNNFQAGDDALHVPTMGNNGDHLVWRFPQETHVSDATRYAEPGAKGRLFPAPTLKVVDNAQRPSEPVVEPTADSQASTANDNPRTLLASYRILHQHGPRTDGVMYRPWQFEEAAYTGWDVLTLPGGTYRSYSYPDWLKITLTRDATLVVVWDGDKPGGWLASWTEVSPVNGKRAFEKRFSAGEVVLGAIAGLENQPYTVLLGEGNGAPAQKPSVPEGRENPVPNDYCPEWVHDQYVAQAPDGQRYPTWHPQIDPVYWCYFGHEHGSDPSLVGDYQPYFEYVAAHVPQHESHEGFKGYSIFHGDVNWYINVHAGTSGHRRICEPLHTVVVVAFDASTREKLAELAYKGDFGPTKSNSEDNSVVRPSQCDNHADLAAHTTAEKKVRIANDDYYRDTGYETWRGGDKPFLGFEAHALVFDFTDPMTSCDGVKCDEVVPTAAVGGAGVTKTLRVGNTRLFYQAELDPDGDGFFYTDVYGTQLVDPSHPNAIRQYVKPGLNVTLKPNEYNTVDVWRGAFYPGRFNVDFMNLEGSIKTPN